MKLLRKMCEIHSPSGEEKAMKEFLKELQRRKEDTPTIEVEIKKEQVKASILIQSIFLQKRNVFLRVQRQENYIPLNAG